MIWNQFLRYPGDFSFKDSVLSSCFSFVAEYALPFVLGSFISAVGRLVFSFFFFFLVSLSIFCFVKSHCPVFVVLLLSFYLVTHRCFCCLTVQFCFISLFRFCLPIFLAARFKAWVCGRSPTEIAGSNLAGERGCLSVLNVVCCQVWDLCIGPITRPEESFQVWYDREVSIIRRPWPTRGCCAMGEGRFTFPVQK